MRFFTLALLLPTILVSAASLTPRQDVCLAELCGESMRTTATIQALVQPQLIAGRGLTNAERLRRGMNPAPPTRRTTAKRTTTSPTPPPVDVFLRGYVRVTNSAGADLGYISTAPLAGFVYTYKPKAEALVVKFNAASLSSFSITAETGNLAATYPVFAGVQGRDNTNADVSIGSFHYLYISGASEATPANAIAQTVANAYSATTGTPRLVETSVWALNAIDQSLTAQWVNADGSAVPVEFFSQSTAMYMSADPAAFAAQYPAPITGLKLFFELIPDVTVTR